MRREIAWAVRHVLASRARRRFLFADGIATPWYLLRFLRTIVPQAATELRGIHSLALAIPDDRLRFEALASIDGKAYHVAGGCILATFLPRTAARAYVELVAPLESIYDYLDNLCDRHPGVSTDAYPILHHAIADALVPGATPRDYYARGPIGDDGGYLRHLVLRTQRALSRLDGYQRLLPFFAEAAALYAEMQTFKHFPAGQRERACIEWFARHRGPRFDGLEWHEFACAAGSQFQVYAPLFQLLAGRKEAIAQTYAAYFPAVSAIHVLLDSFIDQAEDREHGELNFTTVYPDAEDLCERIGSLAGTALQSFSELPDPAHHRFVLRVMLLFYLTHPKVYAQDLQRQAETLLRMAEALR